MWTDLNCLQPQKKMLKMNSAFLFLIVAPVRLSISIVFDILIIERVILFPFVSLGGTLNGKTECDPAAKFQTT
jgi:hypothetical protein